jgi:hypothetical protein
MLPVRGRNRLTPYMIGFKRYIRSGLVVSVIGHLGGLIVALLSVSPNAGSAADWSRGGNLRTQRFIVACSTEGTLSSNLFEFGAICRIYRFSERAAG